jgi:O-antigen/teichoic acid export membrane protein
MAYLAVRKAKYTLFQSVTINVLRLALVALLMGFGVWGLVGSLWFAIGISIVLGIFVFLPRALPNYRPELAFSKKDISKLLPFSFGNYIAFLLMQAPARLLPIFILEFSGAFSAAHAQISWMIGGIIVTPGIALSTSAFVEASNSPCQSSKIFSKATIPGLVITGLAAFILFLVAPWVLLLFGPSYAVEGLTFLRWLSAAAPFAVITNFYFSMLRVEKRISYLIFLSAVLASVPICFSLLLTYKLGMHAFGIGWFIGNLMVSMIAVRESVENPEWRFFTCNIISTLRDLIR